MNRRFVIRAVLAAVAALPVAAFAHEGHTHKVMGTVAAVRDTQLDVKTTDGKTVTVALNAKTTYRQGKVKADSTVLKVGERVVVDAVQAKGAALMSATVVQVAAAPAAAAKR
jgi:hypothetical protein